MHVKRDLTVTSLLGTVLVRRHLGGQVCAQTYLAVQLLPDNTRHNTWLFNISSSFPFQIHFNTIQTASQHTWAEDGYLNCPHPLNIGRDIWLDRWLVRGRTWGLADLWHVYLDKKLGKMGKNAIHFDHHGGRHRHTAVMGPHSWQQSIQQSTNMLCDRSTSLKLEKKKKYYY
jgi:hypothetical protein